MGSRIDSIYIFLRKFSTYIKKDETLHFWVYSGYKEHGSLLIKNMADQKRILFKPWDTEFSIGSTKVKKFIDNSSKFRGYTVDKFIFLGRNFRDNAKRYARSENSIVLIEISFEPNKISIFGSMNIESILLNTLIKFSESIKFESNFDYEGILRHQGFIDGVQQVKKVDEPIPNPTVFISYSWDNEKHKRWVLKLSADLMRSGIRVIVDEWDLSKYQNDLHLFMESGIRESHHVIMVCTPEYSQKANIRRGGVGIESTIITGEFYEKNNTSKYIPIARNYTDRIAYSLPTYLKTKYAIDFKDDEKYDQKFEELLRKILDIPKYKRPELGKIPKLKSNNI
jgi:hypothetical protein